MRKRLRIIASAISSNSDNIFLTIYALLFFFGLRAEQGTFTAIAIIAIIILLIRIYLKL